MTDAIFEYYISDRHTPVKKSDDLWNALLPSDMQAENSDSSATVGHYFDTASVFLSSDDFSVLKAGINKVKNLQILSEDINKVEIYLVKHGQFYHPARIDVLLADTSVSFALNLAVSEDGVACVEREYPVLEKLSRRVVDIPAVYGKGKVVSGNGSEFSMFLAKWFDGYNEFHISYDNGEKNVIVWDYDKGFYYLSEQEVFALYKKAAFIMTQSYNPETFEQIQPWHHAAGDFVVKNDDAGIDVKLITVRQYTSLFENSFDDAESILEAALIFFIGLSIRMRLDRVDGVAESVWADEIVLKAVVEGFFDALDCIDPPAAFGDDFAGSFKKYISGVDSDTIGEFSMMIAGSYHPESSDCLIVADNIQDHMTAFAVEVRRVV